MKVAIVGAGIMGLSTAWALRRRGHDVVVYEQGPIPNPLGSSIDQHRLIRYPYGAERGYTRMVGDAYATWELLFADLGERPYAASGTLVMATGNESWARESASCLQDLGHSLQWLEASELERRFPMISARSVTLAFYVDSGGVLLADRIVAGLARHLAVGGARLVAERQVVDVDPVRARLRLADGKFEDADLLVVAAGAWVTRLMPELQKRVTPSRQVLAYVDPPEDFAPAWEHAPMLLDIDPDSGFYVVPPVFGTKLKIGDHRFSLRGDPDRDRVATAEEAQALFKLCEQRLRDHRRYRITGAKVCFYTVEPRERFLMERRERSFLFSACSGHAFKFGPVLGQRLADTIEARQSPEDLARWAAGEV